MILLQHPIKNIMYKAKITMHNTEYKQITFDDGYIIKESSFIYDILLQNNIISTETFINLNNQYFN